METIFDIFGSRDSVKPPTLNPLSQRLTTKSVHSLEGVLPGKQSIKHEGPNLKGKKVLGDVGNKIKGLITKSECSSNDTIKKSQQNVNSAPKNMQKLSCEASEIAEKNNFQEKPLTSHLIWESCTDFSDLDKWPEVETQGPSFWSDGTYASVWPDVETPTVENFCEAANIWDVGMKCTIERSSSPFSEDYDDTNFCLDLPTTYSTDNDIVLEEPSVMFPWDT